MPCQDAQMYNGKVTKQFLSYSDMFAVQSFKIIYKTDFFLTFWISLEFSLRCFALPSSYLGELIICYVAPSSEELKHLSLGTELLSFSVSK